MDGCHSRDPQRLRDVLATAAKRAGTHHLCPHDLRHWWGGGGKGGWGVGEEWGVVKEEGGEGKCVGGEGKEGGGERGGGETFKQKTEKVGCSGETHGVGQSPSKDPDFPRGSAEEGVGR